MKLPEPEPQFRFCDRLWRLDFAWPDFMIAVEIDGGTYSGGAHVRGGGVQNDCDKRNRATELGWRVFRYTARDVRSGDAVKQISRMFGR
jgi:very-short-patch-repair endonuclease